ncbi:HNH endonuclease [Iningainema tapete]|uniref:HNH endonuclease n=1 Tax=Iningainema tapete BLCC-T55 TaxID=2748662 RepID=A0A8J7C728_9CYAN|nr:HNH endonuclease [Iningainema tapete]MBD2775109.1 HNH endonuclease [Iningainema tapete BLCC-T55]
MPKCRKCAAEFPNRLLIDGKLKNVQNRKFCLNCSPYGRHNTVDLTVTRDKSSKVCPRCKQYLAADAFYLRRDGKNFSPYCKDCTNRQTIERMRRFKEKCVAYKGGKCSRCGYDRCIDALEFHHVNPKEKDLQLSAGKGYSFEKAIPELDKCILVCANCHREIHAEMRVILVLPEETEPK